MGIDGISDLKGDSERINEKFRVVTFVDGEGQEHRHLIAEWADVSGRKNTKTVNIRGCPTC